MNSISSVSDSQYSFTTQASSRSVLTPYHQAAVPTLARVRAQHTVAQAQDQTSLSPESRLLSAALATPDVRTAKIAEIQHALAAGTYRVSSADLAGKLLASLAA